MNLNVNGLSSQTTKLRVLIASFLMFIWIAGCNSAPSLTPEQFVLNFIQKHIPMIDLSVADFYVKEEKSGIIKRVQSRTASNRKKGIPESLPAATYDFSEIKVEILDQKEEFVYDEGVNFLKVAATGNYTKTVNGKTETLIEDEIIIIESVAGTWKVTERLNPWKK